MSQDHPIIKNLTSAVDQLQDINQRINDVFRCDDHHILSSKDRQSLEHVKQFTLRHINTVENIISHAFHDIHTRNAHFGDPGSDPIANKDHS